jgi:hypothetical protein
MNLRNHEIGNLWNSGIYWSSNSEVVAHGDFLNKEIHESVVSQVKDVASKVRVWRVNYWQACKYMWSERHSCTCSH